MTATSTSNNAISRRTVVAGTAWAVPAIVVASAAPAFAASPVFVLGAICKVAGGGSTKQYVFQLNASASGTVTITSVTINNETVTQICPNPQTVVAGQTYTFVASGFADQANGNGRIDYVFNNGVPTPLNFSADNLPQYKNNQCPITEQAVMGTGCPIT